MNIYSWLNNIQEWLLPRLCPGCHLPCSGSSRLCAACQAGLPIIQHSCPRCAIPYMHADVRGECGECQQHPPPFTSTLALYRYAPPVDFFIRALKFHNDLSMSRLLGESLATAASRLPFRPDVLVPVPLHASRLRRRGYNQALEIARPVARTLGIPIDTHGIVRVHDTPSQSQLTKSERRRNLRRAFTARRDYSGQRVALIDDVMTTGETARHIAKVLVQAGASDVAVWVIARTAIDS